MHVILWTLRAYYYQLVWAEIAENDDKVIKDGNKKALKFTTVLLSKHIFPVPRIFRLSK